ncbi:TetR/AcrR family transcriptional regulator [Nonomuraea jabiensis]|uniref:TetR/AcrR family transcriptional regulator n=1 Tax=Nonomuraea jabiensis TaxID=882448 RepID=UPI0036BE0793
MSPPRAAALSEGESLPDHLVAAAARLLARNGAAGLTVRAIAREAQVADGVLYNHFADKEELLALAMHSHVRSVERDLPALPEPGSGDLAGNLRAYVAYGVALHLAIMPAFAGMLARPEVLTRFAALDNPVAEGRGLRAKLADYLRGEQAIGRVSAAGHPDAAATMVVGACHELVLPHLFSGVPATGIEVPPGFVDHLVSTCLHGLAVRPE